MTRRPPFIRSKSRPVLVTPEEFNNLPTSIQMKYFSPGERLRIAKDAAKQARKKQSARESPQVRPSVDISYRPGTGRSSDKNSQLDPARRPQSAHARCSTALPSSVNRSAPLPTDANMPTQGLWSRLGRKDRAYSTGRRSTGSQAILDDDVDKTWLDTDSMYSAESTSTTEAILRQYGYHQQQAPTAVTPQTFPLRSYSHHTPTSAPVAASSSIAPRRKVRLTPLRLPPPTLAPAVPSLPSPTTLEHMTGPILSSRASSVMDVAPDVTHDEEKSHAADKHDEAVQFGFILDEPEHRATSPVSAINPLGTSQFENDSDGDAEQDEHDDDDDDDTDDVSSAVTPGALSLRSDHDDLSSVHHRAAKPEFALPIPPALHTSKASTRSLSPDLGLSDSTIQVSVSKPDFRTSEETLYSYQRKQVSGIDLDGKGALMLQEIFVCDDHTGAQGAFAVQTYPMPKNAGLRKVWNNITRR